MLKLYLLSVYIAVGAMFIYIFIGATSIWQKIFSVLGVGACIFTIKEIISLIL